VQRGLEKERYFGTATAQLHRCRCPVATLCFVSLLHWLRFVASLAEKKERERQIKESERKKIGGNEKIDYLFFFGIVINNLYLLYYYRVIKIEDVNYIMK
jgi:hypothetical protein